MHPELYITETDQRYPEREALGIIWYCEIFQVASLGKFHLETDYKPCSI